MANPPELLTEASIDKLIDRKVSEAIAQHERRFSLYGVPLIIGVVVFVVWVG